MIKLRLSDTTLAAKKDFYSAKRNEAQVRVCSLYLPSFPQMFLRGLSRGESSGQDAPESVFRFLSFLSHYTFTFISTHLSNCVCACVYVCVCVCTSGTSASPVCQRVPLPSAALEVSVV